MALSAPRSRREQHAQDTRAAVLEAARNRFGNEGYAATPLETIAQDAGVTIGAVYHHFGGKAQLFDAVFVQTEADLLVIAQRAIDESDLPGMVDRLCLSFDAYLAAVQDPAIHRIIYIDAPAVLGTERCDEVFDHYGRAGLRISLQRAEQIGKVVVGGHESACRLVFGALVAAATYPAATQEERDAARRANLDGLRALLDALVDPGHTEPVVLPPRTP